jgi:HD-like signal output (HDOD) protein
MTTDAQPQQMTEDRLVAALHDVVSRGNVRVPPYPATALKLQQVLGTDDYTVAQLVEAMRTDPVFTANLLRLANSPFYRRGGEVTSLPVAVQRIGARELVRLAMASSVAKLSGEDGVLSSLRRQVWRQSLSCAMVTEALSHLEGADEGEGFVAGLLHDAGKLLVLVALEDLRRHDATVGARSAREWLALVERFHVPFGEQLAERWHLPGVLGAVVSTHHDEQGVLGPLTRRVVEADSVVTLLEREAVVTVADLVALGLGRPAAEGLAAMLPRIPQALRAFEADGAHEDAPSLIEAEARSPAGRVVEGLRLVVDGASWPVLQVGARSLEVQAASALAPNLMLEVLLEPTGFSFWAIVQRVEAVHGGWVTELTPFALAPEHLVAWESLVKGARAAA